MEDKNSHKNESNRKTAAIFWVIMQRVVVNSHWRFGKIIAPIPRFQEFLNTEKLVRNYHYSLCNEPEERSSPQLAVEAWHHTKYPELNELDIFKVLFQVVFQIVQT